MSAGAIHPLHLLLVPGSDDQRLLRYDANEHRLEQLNAKSQPVAAWHERCRTLLPDADGSSVVVVADVARPHAAYSNAESLIWRDVGALLQTLGLVCEAYRLAFCPLGLLGRELVETLGGQGRLMAAGTAMIGKRAL
jgi:Nitroreductase family